jgi:hypothetical protein
MDLRHGPRGSKGIEVFPDKVGRPVSGEKACVNCARSSVRWTSSVLTGEERTAEGRSGGAQRKYRVKCTKCGHEWWATHPAVAQVANEESKIMPMDDVTKRRLVAQFAKRRMGR